MNLAALSMIVLFATSCSIKSAPSQADWPPPEDRAEDPLTPPSITDSLTETEAPPQDALSEQIDEIDTEGFCKDDVFAKYLIEQFNAKKTTSAEKSSPRSSRRAASTRPSKRDKEPDSSALYYARQRMVGTAASYFGGIPVVANQDVEYWLRYFKTRGRNGFLQWMVRAESLKDQIMPVLRNEGMPTELFYLAMIESGFSNTALSRAKASGTWQFMDGTARSYGLKINHWVDERRDPLKSTVAAARYLRDLYSDFGDWYLAMAAYNAGPGRIRGAMKRSKSSDFWEIAQTSHIRPETKNYVPKMLAALLIATNPREYGFEIKSGPSLDLPNTTVPVPHPIKLTQLSEKLAVPESQLKAWNPELLRGITPPRRDNTPYTLRLPDRLSPRYAEIASQLEAVEIVDIQMHRIRSGDTLSHLARQYRVGQREILSVNPAINATRLRVGKMIAIPVPGFIARAGGPG